MQGQEWHAWEGDYDHYTPAYADGAYTHDDGSQYYQQVSQRPAPAASQATLTTMARLCLKSADPKSSGMQQTCFMKEQVLPAST